ncbi:MAG: alpha/beta hydrolase [Candidatus Alcyoniella australis]|nr:alpha/beta hydrolase [Candidatus Alcyoniella australis]
MSLWQKLIRKSCLLSVMAALLLLCGCGVPTLDIPVLYDAAQVGSQFYAEYPLIDQDVPYVEDNAPLQVLDIFRVESDQPAPVVVFVHGGTWQYTTRKDYGALAETLTERGFVTVIVDFRMYPDDIYPTFVDDTVSALNWTMAHIAEYGGDPQRVILMGHSAGTHLLAMVLTDDTFRSKLTFDPLAQIDGVVLLAGPYHFNIKVLPGVRRMVFDAMGSLENMQHAQPILYARGDIPPTLLMVGEDDDLAKPQLTLDYYAALKEQGAPVQLELIPNNDHYAIVLAMCEGYEGLSLAHTLRFINQRIGTNVQ